MGKLYTLGSPISNTYSVSKNAPLDDRLTVRYIADLTDGEEGGIAALVYKGMVVYVQEDNSLYVYIGASNATWKNKKTGAPMNGGLASNWVKIDSFVDPESFLEYYQEKIGAKILDSTDEFSTIENPFDGQFAYVRDGSEASEDESGLYIYDGGIWTRILTGSGEVVGDFVTKEELKDYLKKSELPDFLTASDLDDYVKVEDLDGYLKPEDIADLAKKSDLDGFVKTEDVIDFLTASDLDDYATKKYVDKKIEDLVGGAPETLDTLKEIAEALEDNATMSKVAETISTKANSADVYTKDKVYTKAEVDAKIDALPTEGSFPELEGSEEKEFVPGLAKVEDVIDYVADAITEAAPDLSDYAKKEDIPVVPENVSAFNNDAGYLTEHQDLSDYAKKEELPTKVSELENDVPYLTEHQDLSDYAKYIDLIDFLTGSDLDDYVKTEVLEGYLQPEDIADLAKKSDLDGYVKVEDAVEFLTASDLDIYVKKENVYTKAEVDAKIDALPTEGSFPEIDGSEEKEFTPGLATVEGVIDYVADSISEAAPDLTPYATKEELPTKVSDLTNDAGYLTEHQDLSDYATKEELPTKVSELENDVPYLTEHQDLSDYAEKDYVDVAIGSLDIPEHSEVLTTDGTVPTSRSGISISNDTDNAFIEEVYVDDYLHAGVYYTSKGINSSKDNGGSELEGIDYITLSNGDSWIRFDNRSKITLYIRDDSLGFNAENIVGIIDSNGNEIINPYAGYPYTESPISLSLNGENYIKFNKDIYFTGMTEVRNGDSTEYIFGQTGSNYEDLDIYSVNVLPSVKAYADGISTRVLTEGDKAEILNKIDENEIEPISTEDIMDLF